MQLSTSHWLKEIEMQLQESASDIDDLQLFEGDTFNMLVVYTDNHTKSLLSDGILLNIGMFFMHVVCMSAPKHTHSAPGCGLLWILILFCHPFVFFRFDSAMSARYKKCCIIGILQWSIKYDFYTK